MPADKKPTISDIARESGFSESTVSLVINNSPKISDKTRERVMDVIARTGYRPNIQARGLALRSTRTLSVMLPDRPHVFADPCFGELISGIYAHASEAGYKILPDVASAKFVRTQEYLNLLTIQQADGMMFLGATGADRYLDIFSSKPHPFLLVDNYFQDSALNYVMVDHRESARAAAAHLLELGHRAVGQVLGGGTQVAADFRDAFERAMADGGVTLNNMPWADGQPGEAQGYAAARELLSANTNLTAFVCGNSRMAEGAWRFLAESGREIPRDFSVIACEEFELPERWGRELTTVRHPLFELGQLACRNLIALAMGELKQCHTAIPPALVVRKSTGPAKA